MDTKSSTSLLSCSSAERCCPAAQKLLGLVAEQAEDEYLWFIAEHAPEAYLQEALRKLHAEIEEAFGET
jgi:hypothetical protein